MKANNKLERFEKIIEEMDDKQLENMTIGLVMFTRLCIDNKFKRERNAVIDFALIAKNILQDRVLKILKENKELPY